MRQPDMIEPELQLAGGTAQPDPLWAMECRACGRRSRYLDHSCAGCGSSRTVGRDRGSFEAHKRALADWDRALKRRKAPPPETFALTPPPGPRQRAAAAPPAEPGALLTLMETRP